MTQHRNLATGEVFSEGLIDALQEHVGALTSNLRLSRATDTALQIVASTGNGQVVAAIGGSWRRITATVSAAIPAGLAAGRHDVFLTAAANDIVAEDNGTFDYSFGLVLLASGGTPAAALSRRIGTFDWDGTRIVAFQQFVGERDSLAPINPTATSPQGVPLRVTRDALQAAPLLQVGTLAAPGDRLALTGAGRLELPVTGTSGGVLLGDANVYSPSTGVVKTDGAMQAASYAVGTTALASTHLSDSAALARLASPAFTGTPVAPTAAADTNTTQLATTAFVVGQLATLAPLMDGTAAAGTSLRFARQDHVHPTDTSRAPLASPALSGTPTAPTATADTNTTQIATTAFVVGQAGSTAPAMNGTAAAGTSLRYARLDHVHPTDTSRVATTDSRLSDQRVPTDLSVTDAKVAAGAGIAKSKLAPLGIVDGDVTGPIAESKLSLASDAGVNTPSRRTLGTGANQAAVGADFLAHQNLQGRAHIVPRVTALPTTGTDGEVVDLQTAAMATRGITWRFKFRSGQTYPWEFIGGGAWYDRWPEVVTAFGIAAGGSPISLSPGRSVAVPASGAYEVHFKGRLWPASGSPSQEGILCPMGTEGFLRDEAINGVWATADNNPAYFNYPWSSVKIVTASTTIEYRGGAPGSPDWVVADLAWTIKPVRLVG